MHETMDRETGALQAPGEMSIQEYAARCGFDTPVFIAAVGQNLGIPDERIARCQRIYERSNADPALTPPFVTAWMRDHRIEQARLKLHKRNPPVTLLATISRPVPAFVAA